MQPLFLKINNILFLKYLIKYLHAGNYLSPNHAHPWLTPNVFPVWYDGGEKKKEKKRILSSLSLHGH